jgi:hypothetical protein
MRSSLSRMRRAHPARPICVVPPEAEPRLARYAGSSGDSSRASPRGGGAPEPGGCGTYVPFRRQERREARAEWSGGWPSPFSDTVTLEFDLPGSSGAVKLVIYDLRGRAVKRPVSGTLERGRYHAVWEGTDISGHPVPSGVYFARLRMGEHDVAAKLLLTR